MLSAQVQLHKTILEVLKSLIANKPMITTYKFNGC